MDSLIGNIISTFIAFLVVVVVYFKWNYQYWKRKNVPYIEPKFPYGTSDNPVRPKEHPGVRFKRYYDYFKSQGHKHGGLYDMLSPSYLVVDLDYIKNILTKDFEYFVDRGIYCNEKDDPLSAHLVAIGGTKWRNLRTKLTPTFTSGKMKMMFQRLVDCIPNFREKIENDSIDGKPIHIKEVLGCFTTDIIGSCAFGLEFDTFNNENSPFRKYGRNFFTRSRLALLKALFFMNFPNAARALHITMTPKHISEFFIKLVKDTVNYREKNNLTRKDFMQLLIDLKNNKVADGQSLTVEEIAAQCFVFFVAGFETSSTTMTFALYELSRRPDLQQKVRDEVNAILAKYDGQITYDAVQEMKYMDQVINESLRMYPPFPFIARRCVKDYKIPDHDVVIEKGTRVIIPVLGMHFDQDYYPEPEKFDPERFREGKEFIHHYAYLPFGEGPRNCIGMRFGLMQSKVGLATLLKSYKFSVNKKTQEPLKMKVRSLVLATEGDVWLNAEKI